MPTQYSASLPPIIFADDFDEHHRIAWRIEQAEPDPHNPLLEGDYPWDDTTVAVGHGTILKDPIDGKWKGWTVVMSSDSPIERGECDFRLAYIESEDGVKWERPMFDICKWEGYEKTNIILDYTTGGRTSFASVLIDPEANPEEPYEMFCFRWPNWDPTLQEAHEGEEGYNRYFDFGIFRYRSKDGIHWRVTEGPIDLKTADACYIYPDPKLGYVAHYKISAPAGPGTVIPPYECGPDLIRMKMKRTSPDGTNWSPETYLMGPDRNDHPDDQVMEVGRFAYGDGFIGLTTMYHCLSQKTDVQFSASPDGEKYWRPIPRTACLPNPPLGDYGGGMLWPFRTPIEHEGRLYVYYGALAGLHGDLYSAKPDMRLFRSGALCRASWDMGRFYGAVNVDGGELPYAYLTTKPLEVTGEALYLNARTMRKGEILVELLDAAYQPILGFTKDDCQPFQGDEKFVLVSWRGGSKPPATTARIRFYLTTGIVYGFTWQ